MWAQSEIAKLADQDGRSYRIWFVFSYRNAGMLCARRSQRMVHLGVRWSVRIRVSLWFPARGMALRRGRSYMGARSGSPMATQEQIFKLTH